MAYPSSIPAEPDTSRLDCPLITPVDLSLIVTEAKIKAGIGPLTVASAYPKVSGALDGRTAELAPKLSNTCVELLLWNS